MKTIIKDIDNEIIINKSRFITFLIRVDNINEVSEQLIKIKKEYKDATHYCYSYIIDNIKRFSDDGEPGGTAGMPILNVLENNNLDHVLCVVVRYFGGIKLGAGGLVRAYTKSVTSCLEKTDIKELEKGYKIKLTFSYDVKKDIDNLLKNYDIVSIVYADNIYYEINLKQKDFNIEEFNKIDKIEIIEEIYI